MTKSEAGRKGGLNTVKKHGRDHMRALGRKGAKAFHEKYNLVPVGINDFLIVDKVTEIPCPKTLCGVPVEEYR